MRGEDPGVKPTPGAPGVRLTDLRFQVLVIFKYFGGGIKMSLIDFPIKLSFGREKQPTNGAITLDGKDVAILCLGVALLFTTLAVVSLAAQR